ncbi:MAG: hypothetical protein ACYDC6_14260 [Acidobacteriaceae bacterium]
MSKYGKKADIEYYFVLCRSLIRLEYDDFERKFIHAWNYSIEMKGTSEEKWNEMKKRMRTASKEYQKNSIKIAQDHVKNIRKWRK